MGGVISFSSSDTNNSTVYGQNTEEDHPKKIRKPRKKENTITCGPICYKQKEQMFHHHACVGEICQCPSGIVTDKVNKHQEYFRYRRTNKD